MNKIIQTRITFAEHCTPESSVLLGWIHQSENRSVIWTRIQDVSIDAMWARRIVARNSKRFRLAELRPRIGMLIH